MCRMFALRSAHRERIGHALLDAPNCLRALSREHRHGWGIAQYVGARPAVIRGTRAAHEDPEFAAVARSVEGECSLAHVRKASVGMPALANTHPFTFRRWVFAHNGTVRRFGDRRRHLEGLAAERYLALVRGDTDSERCFAIFLTELDALGALKLPPVEVAAAALARTVHRVSALVCDPETSLTFLASDGASLIGVRHGERELGFSYIRADRLLIASEPPSRDLPWTELASGELVATDASLQLRRFRMRGGALEQLGTRLR
jgi:predicted glutamine amidotransferase